MWGHRKNNSNNYSIKKFNVSLSLETLDFRAVPSSILDLSTGDPTLTSLTSSDSIDQAAMVSTLDTSSGTATTTTDSTQTDNSADGNTSPTSASTTNDQTTDSTGSPSGTSTTDTSSTGSTGTTSLPTTAPKTASNIIASTTGTTTNSATTTIPVTATSNGTSTAGNTTTHLMTPDDTGGGGATGGIQSGIQTPPPGAPQIVSFGAVEVVGGVWDFTGTVIDANPAGLTVKFGGEPESLQGASTTTNANGNFDYATMLNTNGSDNGTATAQTTDGQGLTSNLAMCLVQAS